MDFIDTLVSKEPQTDAVKSEPDDPEGNRLDYAAFGRNYRIALSCMDADPPREAGSRLTAIT